MYDFEVGDDVARGVVTECPRCEELSFRDGLCENPECLHNEGDEIFYNPFDYTDDPKED
jgi:uncharacterized protein (DUF983 family)